MTKEQKPLNRVVPIVVLSDQDLEECCGIDPRQLNDDQFCAIAEALKVFYEEELCSVGKEFKANLEHVFTDPEGDYSVIYAGKELPEDLEPAPPETIQWRADIWLEMPVNFCLPTSLHKTSSEYIELTFCNGVWVSHSDIEHYIKFDVFEKEKRLLLYNGNLEEPIELLKN